MSAAIDMAGRCAACREISCNCSADDWLGPPPDAPKGTRTAVHNVETCTSRYRKDAPNSTIVVDAAGGIVCEAGDTVTAERIIDALEVSETHEVFYMQLADDGEAIRKWSRSPFAGARKCRVALESIPA